MNQPEFTCQRWRGGVPGRGVAGAKALRPQAQGEQPAQSGSLGPAKTVCVGRKRTKAAEWPGGMSLITEETQSGVSPAFLSTISTPTPPHTLSLGITLVPSSRVCSTTGLFHRMHRSLRTTSPPWGPVATHRGTWAGWGPGALGVCSQIHCRTSLVPVLM